MPKRIKVSAYSFFGDFGDWVDETKVASLAEGWQHFLQ